LALSKGIIKPQRTRRTQREEIDIKTKEDELSYKIIGAAMEVHAALGPGLLESANETCLFHELTQKGMNIQRQVPIPVVYKGIKLDCGFRLDLLVDDCDIVELKSVDKFAPIHEAQAITYLKLTGKRLCLLINFNVVHLRDGGIKRVVLNL
jgi:GxxExxY protein